MKIRGLSIIATICFVIVLIIDFTSFKIPEIIEGTASRAENLIYTLSISYIASYIFYVLNVYLRERQEQKSVFPLIANNVINIISNNRSIIAALKHPSKTSMTDLPTLEEFKVLLKEVNPKENTPLAYWNKSWISLFQSRRESTLNAIDKIFASGKHVDDNLRMILLKMQSSLYLKEDYAFNSESFDKVTLESYNLVFSNYFELIQELNVFYNKNLKTHYERSLPDKINVLFPDGDKFKLVVKDKKDFLSK